MTIRLEDGSVMLEDVSWSVNAGLREADFRRSAIGSGAEIFGEEGARHVVYRIGPHSVAQKPFIIDLVFSEGSLASVLLSPVGDAVSWDDVNEEQLIALRRSNMQWLRDELGVACPSRFSWGTIEVTIDRKTWDAPIVLAYKSSAPEGMKRRE